MATFLEYLRDLNLFPSKDNTNTNVYEQHSNKLATRAYLLTFIFVVIGITIALSLIFQTETNVIISPTKDEFDAFSDHAQCPCTQLSFSYGSFISVQVISSRIDGSIQSSLVFTRIAIMLPIFDRLVVHIFKS